MNKFLKVSSIILLMFAVIIGGSKLMESTESNAEEKVKQKTEQTENSFDHAEYIEGELNSIHIVLGSILGKFTVNNGGVPLTEDDHKTMLKEMKFGIELIKEFEYYPIEMTNLLDLLEKTNAFDEEKQLNIEAVEEMFNIVTNL